MEFLGEGVGGLLLFYFFVKIYKGLDCFGDWGSEFLRGFYFLGREFVRFGGFEGSAVILGGFLLGWSRGVL